MVCVETSSVRLLFPARSRHAQDESGAGGCVNKCARCNVCSRLDFTPRLARLQWNRKWEVGKKMGSEGSDHKMSLGFPEEHSSAGDNMCQKCMFFWCVGCNVTPDTCCIKSHCL